MTKEEKLARLLFCDLLDDVEEERERLAVKLGRGPGIFRKWTDMSAWQKGSYIVFARWLLRRWPDAAEE